MCMAAAGLALSLVSGIASYGMQVQNYNAAVSAHNQTVKNTQKELVDSYAFDQHRIRQEQLAASEKKFEAQIEGAERAAAQATASGEAGVTGAGGYTPFALLGSSYAAMGRFMGNVDTNFSMQRDQLRYEMTQNEKEAKRFMTSSYNSLPPKPSPLSIFSSISL